MDELTKMKKGYLYYADDPALIEARDRKSTRLNSSH